MEPLKDDDDARDDPEPASHEDEKHELRQLFTYKLAKQVCLVSMWVSMGLFLEILGPTIPDLKVTFGFTYEEISRGLSIRSAGLLLGSLIGGFSQEAFHRHTDAILSLGLLSGAVGIFFVPWSSSLPVFIFLLTLTGVGAGLINTGGMPMVLDLWGEKSAAPMHSIHFGYSLGAIIVPQLAEPFLIPDLTDEGELKTNISGLYNSSHEDQGITIDLTTSVSTNASAAYFQPSRLVYPYSIVAAVTTALALVMFGFYLKGPPKRMPFRKTASNLSELISPASCVPGFPGYSVILLICLFTYYFHAVGGELVYGTFLFSYVLDADLSFTKSQAAVLSSVYFASLLIGRFSGIFIGHYVPVHAIIIIDTLLLLITMICVTFLSYSSVPAIWVLSILAGSLLSVLFASGMVWANLYLIMNSVSTMVCVLGCSAGGLSYLYLTGYLFDAYGVVTFGYILISHTASLLILFVVMSIVGRRLGTRAERVRREDTNSCSDNEGDDSL